MRSATWGETLKSHSERLEETNERMNEPMWSEIQAANVEAMQCRRGEVGDHYALYMETLAKLNRATSELHQMRVSAEILARYALQITQGPCPTAHSPYKECPHCAGRRMARHVVDLVRNKSAARCGDGGAGAHTAGPTEHFIPEAL